MSVRTRLTIRWTLAVAALLGVTLCGVYAASRTFAYRELDAQVRTLAATELASATDSRSIHLHQLPVDSIGGAPFAAKFAQVYSTDGTVLVQSPGLEDVHFQLPSPAIAAAIRGDAPLLALTVGTRPARIAVLRTSTSGQTYLVAAGFYTETIDAALDQLARVLVLAWVFGVAMSTAGAALAARRTLARIDRITQRASSVARGDFTARLDPPSTDDEIGRMTRLLNEVLDRLNGALEANRRFAADASHELRGPLTAMAGEIDVALKRERSAVEYRETLEVLKARLRDLGSIADNLILLTRLQERPREAVRRELALVPLLQASASRLRSLADARGITIRFEEFPDLFVYGDAALLGRVFDNLLGNAVQYNRDHGEVVLKGRLEEAAPDAWEPGVAVVTVADTGPGIPTAEWDRVFERFRRLDGSRSRRTGGTGLGLAISRAIVEVFSGTLAVVASSAQGTTFELRLPGRAGTGLSAVGELVPIAHTTRHDAPGSHPVLHR